jgi:hypothetical protein
VAAFRRGHIGQFLLHFQFMTLFCAFILGKEPHLGILMFLSGSLFLMKSIFMLVCSLQMSPLTDLWEWVVLYFPISKPFFRLSLWFYRAGV